MPEVSGTEFFKSVTSDNANSREFKIADDQNRYITVELTEVDRQDLFDQLHRLPGGFIELMMSGSNVDAENLEEVEDPEDIDLDVDGSEMLAHIDGSTIDVFETLFSMSAEHPDLTSLDMEDVAERLSFEVLFEAGGEVIDLSLSDQGQVKRFREPGSDKSS